MRTYHVMEDGELIETDTPAVVLSRQFMLTGYRVHVPPEWGWFDVIDAHGHVVSVHSDFAEACAERDRLNGAAS